ncbi:MAG: beta-ketoacyl-ACP synthase 3 [Bacteroidales bacterium]|nr:beta-ketoacyl-ACP synthase 3 [Bacteroidales bacterium]
MKIIGTGSALPEKIVTNDMLAGFLETSDGWITTRTGIKTRRLLSKETLGELAITAATAALDSSGVAPENIDYLICSNVANSYVTPSMSSIILGLLGCSCPCTDLNGACAGFIYALDIADAFIKTGRAKNILIVAAEEPSRFCNWHERETSVLFADGAGAVVVTEGEGFKDFRVTADTHTDVLYYKRAMEATPYDRVESRTTPLVMQGREVFKLAVRACIKDCDIILEKNGMTGEDIDMYLLHQANLRIIDSIREHLEQPKEKFPTNLQKYGNTSSASIPILMDELSRAGVLKDGMNLLLSAFGGGFVTGAAILKWSSINYPVVEDPVNEQSV